MAENSKEAITKNKVEAKIDITKNIIVVSCPSHKEFKRSEGDVIKERSIYLEAGEADCKYCDSQKKNVSYFWPEIAVNLFDEKK